MGIRLENVSFQYQNKAQGSGDYVLKKVNLSLNRGEYAAVIGKTGSGKSTLLQHLNGLLTPSGGTYYFEGQNVHRKGYPLQALRQKVALCFQYPEYQLFEENVLKDIAFGPKNMGFDNETCKAKAREAMRMTGLSPELEKISPFSLSGGQRRRVALAGILAMNPEYLILDEPAAGLDQEGKENLFFLLDRLNREENMAILLVSHDMEDVAGNARRVIVMKDGCILADDSPENIFGNDSLMEAAGLEQPKPVQFYNRLLKRAGLPPSSENVPLTVQELARSISSLISIREVQK